MNKYSHLDDYQRDHILTGSRLKASQNEMERLIKETTTEEETFKANNSLQDHAGYKYYKKELEIMDARAEKKRQQIELNHKSFKERKEAEIKKLEQQIEELRRQIEIHAETNESKVDIADERLSSIRQDYVNKILEIQATIGRPTSLMYRRKKTRIEELEKLIEKQREDFVIACEYKKEKNKAEYIRQAQERQEKEDEKERKAKAEALAAWERQQEATREADRQRWATKGLETETADVFNPDPEFDLTTPAGRNAKKMYDRKKAEAKAKPVGQ